MSVPAILLGIAIVGFCGLVVRARVWLALFAVAVGGLMWTGALHLNVSLPSASAHAVARPARPHVADHARATRHAPRAHHHALAPTLPTLSAGHPRADLKRIACDARAVRAYLDAHHLRAVAGLLSADSALTHAALAASANLHC